MACCTYQLAGPAVSQHQPTFSGVHKSKELVHNHNGDDPLFLFKREKKAKEKRQKHGPAFVHSFSWFYQK
jgi:hypothetical protein